MKKSKPKRNSEKKKKLICKKVTKMFNFYTPQFCFNKGIKKKGRLNQKVQGKK